MKNLLDLTKDGGLMKLTGLIISLTLIGTGFSSCRKSATVSMARAAEPTYLQDRRVEEYIASRTNSQGASGTGLGAAASANFYRKEALKGKRDTASLTQKNNLSPEIQQPQELNKNLQDTAQYDAVPW